jgi:hypothetical protein
LESRIIEHEVPRILWAFRFPRMPNGQGDAEARDRRNARGMRVCGGEAGKMRFGRAGRKKRAVLLSWGVMIVSSFIR